MLPDYFPLGLAQGSAFCNRVAEQKYLINNIVAARPTLVISPRRYGKTSLVLYALNKQKIPFAHIDLFSEITQEDVERSIIRGVGAVINHLASSPERALTIAREFFQGLHIKFSLKGEYLNLELETRVAQPQEELKETLFRLDALAKSKQKQIVLFIDEFQQLGEIASDISTEAVIRHVVQQVTHITFIFSGSHRHLLERMFDDRNRPFYRLCDKIDLQRISQEHYIQYIKKAEMEQWGMNSAASAIETILTLTEQHPYYVNALCSRLWRASKPPTSETAQEAWIQLAQEEKSQIAAELDLLSKNQRSLLISLVRTGQSNAPGSQAFSAQTGLSISSTAQALKVLEKKDYVYRDADGYYKLIDPLLRQVIQA